ncbi:hypothetical protein HAP47_0039485 [Bradyrhizobium sp. 41S5]|uniref:hypothetical protein n=1 Tax=Bradyrhizobium sp. 41S5 TaxID=1404443 RepID=UPI00156AA9F4|nr:hypothetical protein [Bradyrhizobium sp. 41S5]UFX44971.1 hypothetical protein HAP47_0039485 [Bradyrhizobium sp. 41S5]
MKTLPHVAATAEQLPLISQNRFGVEVICGAAGSGKTSTAILRLRSLCYMFAARRARRGDQAPVRVLVLTYNRTLAGYVRALAEHQISTDLQVSLEIETFGRWAMSALNFPDVKNDKAKTKLKQLARQLGVLSPAYIVKEAEYLLGRFEPEDLARYLVTERTGRGALLRPISEEYKSGDAIWQWFALPFGQSILAKRKANLRDKVNSSQLPGPPQHQNRSINSRPSGQTTQSSLPLEDTFQGKLQPTNRGAVSSPRRPNDGIDEWTDVVIRSNFNDAELGRLLNHCIDSTNSVDAAIAFSAIVAKAKLARKKRR